jgi:hypothetical protein
MSMSWRHSVRLKNLELQLAFLADLPPAQPMLVRLAVDSWWRQSW